MLVVRGQQSPAWTSVTGYAAGKINTHSLALRHESSKLADTALFVTFVADRNTTGHLMIAQRKKILQSVFLAKHKKESLKSDLFSFGTSVFTSLMPFLRSRANSLLKVG